MSKSGCVLLADTSASKQKQAKNWINKNWRELSDMFSRDF